VQGGQSFKGVLGISEKKSSALWRQKILRKENWFSTRREGFGRQGRGSFGARLKGGGCMWRWRHKKKRRTDFRELAGHEMFDKTRKEEGKSGEKGKKSSRESYSYEGRETGTKQF